VVLNEAQAQLYTNFTFTGSISNTHTALWSSELQQSLVRQCYFTTIISCSS